MVMHVHCDNKVMKKEICFLGTLTTMEINFIRSDK